MSTNKKEIFLSLVKEFQKLKNLEAQYPELKADFNAIAPAHEVEKIGDLLAKQQAKIMAKEAAVGAVQSETMMEEDKPKLDFDTFQYELIQWKTNQLQDFYLIENKNIIISKLPISNYIDAIKQRVVGCTLLSNMYSQFKGKLTKEQISIAEIIAGFEAVFNEYDFTETKLMKKWFGDDNSEKWFKNQYNESFKNNLLDLAGAIGKAVEAAEKAKENQQHFLNWCNWNIQSLRDLDSLGFINSNQFRLLINEHYSSCNFVSKCLLTNIDENKVYNNINVLKNILLNNINTLKNTITAEEKNNVCTKVDTSSKSTLRYFLEVSQINNFVSAEAFNAYINKSAETALSSRDKNISNQLYIVDINKVYISVLNLLSTDTAKKNLFMASIILDAFKALSNNKDYEIYNKCIDQIESFIINLQNNNEQYRLTCEKIPQSLIPLDSMILYLQEHSTLLEINKFREDYLMWRISEWNSLAELDFDNELTISKSALLTEFKALFKSNYKDFPFEETLLNMTTLQEYLKSKPTGDSIQWKELKPFFSNSSNNKNYEEYLNSSITALIEAKQIILLKVILNEFRDNLPSKESLVNAIIKANNATKVPLKTLSTNKVVYLFEDPVNQFKIRIILEVKAIQKNTIYGKPKPYTGIEIKSAQAEIVSQINYSNDERSKDAINYIETWELISTEISPKGINTEVIVNLKWKVNTTEVEGNNAPTIDLKLITIDLPFTKSRAFEIAKTGEVEHPLKFTFQTSYSEDLDKKIISPCINFLFKEDDTIFRFNNIEELKQPKCFEYK